MRVAASQPPKSGLPHEPRYKGRVPASALEPKDRYVDSLILKQQQPLQTWTVLIDARGVGFTSRS